MTLLLADVTQQLMSIGILFTEGQQISNGVFQKWKAANRDGGVAVRREQLTSSDEDTLAQLGHVARLVKMLLPPFPFNSERQLQQEIDHAIDAGIMSARREYRKTVFQIGMQARYALRRANKVAKDAGKPLPYKALVKTIDRIKRAQDKARPSLPHHTLPTHTAPTRQRCAHLRSAQPLRARPNRCRTAWCHGSTESATK